MEAIKASKASKVLKLLNLVYWLIPKVEVASIFEIFIKYRDSSEPFAR